MGPPQSFQRGKIPDKPNFAGFFANLQEKRLKHHYLRNTRITLQIISVQY